MLPNHILRADDVTAVGCAGMVPAVLCLDAEGNPLAPAILQNDARATAEITELADELEAVDLLRRTGSPLSQQSVEVADLAGIAEGARVPVSVREHGVHLYAPDTGNLLFTT